MICSFSPLQLWLLLSHKAVTKCIKSTNIKTQTCKPSIRKGSKMDILQVKLQLTHETRNKLKTIKTAEQTSIRWLGVQVCSVRRYNEWLIAEKLGRHTAKAGVTEQGRMWSTPRETHCLQCHIMWRSGMYTHKPWKMINLQGVTGADVASLTAHPNALILSKFSSYFLAIHIIRIFKEL